MGDDGDGQNLQSPGEQEVYVRIWLLAAMTTLFLSRSVCKSLLKVGAASTTAAFVAPQVVFCAKSRFSVMADGADPTKAENIYGFSAKDIDGNMVSLEKYRGHVCVVVNVASQ